MMVRKDMLVTGLTQDQLAEKLGVSQSLVCKWFSGKVIPRPLTIKRICSVCDVTEKEFIDYIYEKHNRLNDNKDLV